MKKLSENDELRIISLYESGKNSKEIVNEIGYSSSTILRVLKRNNIKIRSKGVHAQVHAYTKDKIEKIISMYKEGRNTNEIAKYFNTYNTTIRRILLRNDIPIRSYGVAKRKIKLEDIKLKEGTNDFDYFLGLLATDGCVTGNKIILDFSEQNKELLYYWNDFLDKKCNITCYINKKFNCKQYRIAFANPEIVELYANYGIISKKTFNLNLKYINWDVLRGIIDGDGCVYSSNKNNTIVISITSGCEKFLIQIQDFLEKNNIKSYIYNRTNQPSTYDLKIFKSKDILNIYENLYKNAHFFLIRKKLKYGSLLEKFNRQPLVNSGKEKCNSNPEPSLI